MSSEPLRMRESYWEFKRRFAEAFVQSHGGRRGLRGASGGSMTQPIQATAYDADESDSGQHVLVLS